VCLDDKKKKKENIFEAILDSLRVLIERRNKKRFLKQS
jgi:hypothetical protein